MIPTWNLHVISLFSTFSSSTHAYSYQLIIRTALEVAVAFSKIDVDVYFLLDGTHGVVGGDAFDFGDWKESTPSNNLDIKQTSYPNPQLQ